MCKTSRRLHEIILSRAAFITLISLSTPSTPSIAANSWAHSSIVAGLPNRVCEINTKQTASVSRPMCRRGEDVNMCVKVRKRFNATLCKLQYQADTLNIAETRDRYEVHNWYCFTPTNKIHAGPDSTAAFPENTSTATVLRYGARGAAAMITTMVMQTICVHFRHVKSPRL